MHAVLLDQSIDSLITTIAEVVAQSRNVPFQDAMSLIRHGWGFLLRNAEEQEARTLTEKLAHKGIKTKILEEVSLKALPPLQKVEGLALANKTLQMILNNRQSVELQARRIVAVAAAGLPFRTTSTQKTTEGPSAATQIVKVGIMLATGLPLPIGKKKKVVEKTQITNDIVFYMDLIGVDPVFRYRVDAQHLNYSFLKERMLYNALQNFKLLLNDVTHMAPQALKNKGTEVLLRQEPVATMGYDSLDDFEKETHWLWNRI